MNYKLEKTRKKIVNLYVNSAYFTNRQRKFSSKKNTQILRIKTSGFFQIFILQFYQRRCGSVVEHILGKDEVESSILFNGTVLKLLKFAVFFHFS